LEIRHGTETSDDRGQALLAREVDRQAGVARDGDAFVVLQRLARELDALLEPEQRCLLRARGDRDDEAIEEPQAAPDQILVTASDRIERAGIHRAVLHCGKRPCRKRAAIVASALRGRQASPSTAAARPYSTSPARARFRHSKPGNAGSPSR